MKFARRQMLFGITAAVTAPTAASAAELLGDQRPKIALMRVTANWQWLNRKLLPNMPAGVEVIGTQEDFCSYSILLKLRGEGLPERCRVVECAEYQHVSLIEFNGVIRFVE